MLGRQPQEDTVAAREPAVCLKPVPTESHSTHAERGPEVREKTGSTSKTSTKVKGVRQLLVDIAHDTEEGFACRVPRPAGGRGLSTCTLTLRPAALSPEPLEPSRLRTAPGGARLAGLVWEPL